MLIRVALAAFSALMVSNVSWATEAVQAARVTITRDDWGIAHVKGKTDSDAVFGMIYAQAEDDFNRVETNYLTSLGRLAEADGQEAIWKDLRQRLFIASVEFGPKVEAWAVSVGGESGDPASRHFLDQAQRYADGNFRRVYFYPADLEGHVESRETFLRGGGASR
jgi:acyl-homoserine lactone acylase PvdQ